MALYLPTTFADGTVGEYWVVTDVWLFNNCNVDSFATGYFTIRCWLNDRAFRDGLVPITLGIKQGICPTCYSIDPLNLISIFGDSDVFNVVEYVLLNGFQLNGVGPFLHLWDDMFGTALQVP